MTEPANGENHIRISVATCSESVTLPCIAVAGAGDAVSSAVSLVVSVRGHSELDWGRQAGPLHQSGCETSCEVGMPLEAQSAGLCAVGTCRHCARGSVVRISDTRFATNVFHLDGWLRSQASTRVESVQQNVGTLDKPILSVTKLKALTNRISPHSSRRGTLCFLRGATRVFANKRLILEELSEFKTLIYTQAAKA